MRPYTEPRESGRSEEHLKQCLVTGPNPSWNPSPLYKCWTDGHGERWLLKLPGAISSSPQDPEGKPRGRAAMSAVPLWARGAKIVLAL